MEGAIPIIPIIDISPFLQTEQNEETQKNKRTVAKKLFDACVNVGFFYVIGHGIAEDIVNGAHENATKFFQLSTEEKQKILIKPGVIRGYQCLGENVTQSKRDWHEAIDYYKELEESELGKQNEIISLESKHDEISNRRQVLHNLLYGKNPYPELNSFKEFYQQYIQIMLDLGKSIMRAMALGLGLSETWFEDSHSISNPFWVMRIISYPPLQTSDLSDVGISCGEHTDYGCLTIVNQDSTKGALQIQCKNGEFIDANPIPGAFVMNIGDMMTVWTNGLFKSTVHRVVHKSENVRTSLPFFYEPNFEARVSPLPVCVNVDGKEYPPKTYGVHLLDKTSTNFKYD
eukprot:TRINITY_DN9246_c0_g1_i1.p1 TRINITY_DN9246_c0_g1~~TRINITY_DN9246_c0_g1_i1.p1  ORF type:complete len:344 (+),score=65.37 TRINITY_DN9246_c0_g1_i1:24-1055(+)